MKIDINNIDKWSNVEAKFERFKKKKVNQPIPKKMDKNKSFKRDKSDSDSNFG